MNRRIWLILALAALAIIGASSIASASYPSGATEQSKGGGNIDLQHAQDKDGYSALSPGLKALSMSTLIQMGLVKPQDLPALPKPVPNQNQNKSVPNVAITWGADAATGPGNEPSAVVHPSNPLFALVSGNVNIDNTSNGGTTWQTRPPANPSGNGDVVVSWLPTSPSQDWAYNASLNTSHGANITSGRSTDRGVTWANFPSNIDTAAFFNDREYLWVDQDSTSPFYGRLYVTGTFFDTGGSGSFNSTWIKWSSDNGATWSVPFTEDAHALSATNGNAQFSSVGFGPGGVIYHGWMNVRCCGDPPSFGTANFYKWAKSTDGGVTFPVSGTAASDVAARSVSFNSNGPAGFRWSPQATLAADPGDNNVYMIWLKKRVDNSNVGVAVNFARSSDSGTTWNTPSIVFNDPNANDTQYMPWIIVSPDHTIHVTYSSSVNNGNTPLAHFYVQSTDRGVTWSAPFQLSAGTYAPGGFQGDYQATHIGNVATCTALEIIASWTASGSHHARMGSFSGCGGPPTPTVTGTPPTATPTRTNTATNTIPPTPCAIVLNEGFESGNLGLFTNVVPICTPGGCNWTSVASNPHSGTRSAFAPDGSNISDQYLEQTTGIVATAGSTLSFWHSIDSEPTFDGGVLEATTNNGATWTDMEPNITSGGYDGPISSSFGSPIAGRNAWNGSHTAYRQVTVNLTPYAGQSLRIRFRLATDNSVGAVGWNVDDVQILGNTGCGSVTPAPTNTSVPATNTPTGSVPTPTCAAGGPIIVNGVLDGNDPTLALRLFRDDPASTCAVPQPFAGTSGAGPYFYDAYTYPNTTGSSACVNINVDPLTCTGTPFLHASAYLNTFDPNNLGTNFLGDIGASPLVPTDFSVTVPAGQSVVIVVNSVTAGAGGGCPGYTLTITGLGAGCATPGTPVPTNTSSVPTPTCAAGGSGVWTAALSYPVTNVRYGFAQVGNAFYVIGGVSDGTRIANVNRYDVGANTWTALAPIPVASEAPACAYNAGANKIYCAEGDTGNSFQIYDVAANTWSAGPAVPGAANRYGAAAGSSGNLVYIVGGSSSFQSDVQVYNIGTNTWSTGTPAANPLLLPGYQTVGQYLYVVGGFSGTPSGAKASGVPASLVGKNASSNKAAPDANNPTTLRLDMTTGTWSTGPAFTPGRADFGLAYSGGSLYAIGGDADGGAFFDSTNLVDSLSVGAWPAGTWASSTPNLPSPARQANQAGFTSTDGSIWSTGGIVGQTFQFISDHIYRSQGGCTTPVATNTPGTVVPTPTCAAGGLTEGFESGTLGAFTNVVPICNPGGCNWVSVASNPHSGTNSAFAPDGSDISDQYLELTNPIVPSAGNTLTFWHSIDSEPTFDGGVLEATTDNGATWTDMEPNITSGGYDGPISVNFGSPIAGRNAWNGSVTTYRQTTVNLTPYAGQNLRIRFRLATDNSVGAVGWNIDDIVIGGGCATPGTPVPSNTPNATATCAPFRGTIGLGNPGKANLVSNDAGTGKLASSNKTFSRSVTPKKSVYNPLGPVTFILDDGVLEDAISLNNGSTAFPAVWINRFSPTAGQFPLTLNQISVLFPDASVAGANLVGRAIDLLVYLDTDGNNDPSNATKLLQQSETITVADGTTFSNYPVNVVVSGPGDVYIGFSDTYNSNGVSPVTFPASIDQTASQVRSWVAGMSTNANPDYDNLGNNDLIGTIDSFGLPGNWLIRASGTVGGGNPCVTETPGTVVPTATPTCAASAGSWSAGADLPTTLTRAQGAYLNGKFYAIGGRTGDGDPTLAQMNPLEYDPVGNTWVAKTASFSDQQTSNVLGGILTVSGTPVIMVVGGSAGGGTTGTTETRMYDPVADTMTTVATDPWTPGATTLPGGTAVFNNKLYVLGGFEINVGMTTAIWEYDPTRAAGSRWLLKSAVLPTALGYVPSATVGNYIYTIGGSEWDGTTLVDSAVSYKYDPVADTITAITSTPRATGETRALEYGGKVWVFGGGRVAPNPGNQVEIYDPVTDTYTSGPSFATARRNFPVATDGTKIYLAGGYDVSGTTLLASTEIFTPGGGCPTATATPSTPVPTPTCAASAQLILDGSFEGGSPSSAWTEESTNFGTPICDETTCGNGGGTTGPRTGTWWSWFGGIDAIEDGAVSQTVNIPSGTASLEFYLWIGAHSGLGASDYFRVLVGGTEVFRADDTSTAYDSGYVLVSLDVSAQSGGSRVVRFEEHNGSGGSNVFNVSLDDVTLNAGSGCVTPTETATGVVPTATETATATGVVPTDTPVAPTETETSVPTAVPTSTVCPLQFTDVPVDHTFYANIRCLVCRGIINGYNTDCPTGIPCFRPDNNVTRGQISKMVSNSAGFTDTASGQQYQDVLPGSTFYDYIYRLDLRDYINGYPCGGPGEPCVAPDNLPYFRPNASITRGQISKIVSNGAGLVNPAGAQQYEDVLPGSTFYDYIWRLTDLGVMKGYPCGGPGEPCIAPGNLPYFRPGANATRGQASKIVSNTFFPGCVTPNRNARIPVRR